MIGKTISHYKIIEKIGGGGMGVVYKARDLKLDRFVALKFLPPHFTTSEEEKKRFIHEAKAASALDHNNICVIHEIDETDDEQMFISMAFYEGKTLDKRIKEKPLTQEEAIDIAIQIAEGLAKAHEKEIVHRDIKPANVMLTADGVVKILDFGLAKLSSQTKLTRESTTVGTASYMSPEQAIGEKVGCSTDIWSLGVVLYEMLTGETPFKGDYEQAVIYSILNTKPDLNIQMFKKYPSQLITILDKSLQKDISQRIASANQFKADLQSIKSQGKHLDAGQMKRRKYIRPGIIIPAGLVIIVISILLSRQIYLAKKIRWAKDIVLPQIEQLKDAARFDNNIEAYNLALSAEEYIPNDKKLVQLMRDLRGNILIKSQPPGANVYRKPFDKPKTEWIFMGQTPLNSRNIPHYLFRWKIEMPGYETLYRLRWSSGRYDYNKGMRLTDTLDCVLDRSGILPENMVRIPGNEEIAEFLIDRYEVTNSQFKRFVANSGYRDKTYWKHPFIKSGREVAWEEVVTEFKDMTGRLGPATWEGGSFLEGEENYPVSGVSWYEAAAYAEFAGKNLPTVAHWGAAREGRLRGAYHLFYPMCNFGGMGPVAVATTEAITQFGIYDMAGNVREWCWNKSQLGRCIRGGAWNDATYMFGNITQANSFDRSPKNGFRCVIYSEKEKVSEKIFQPLTEDKPRNYYEEVPESDEVYYVFEDIFSYDKSDLKASMEANEERSDWIYQKVSFRAAYENEQIIIHLFLPKNAKTPYQTVIYFPGSGSVDIPSSKDIENYWEFTNKLSFLVKNGRAVVYPVYKGTFERRNGIESSLHLRYDESHEFKDYMIKVIKDFRRVIDYLETRSEIDANKIAYFGYSWGGVLGGYIPAIEKRIQITLLDVGGFSWGKARPEVDAINYVPRITTPVLMLNGEYDMVFPYETSSKPMFDLLGTQLKDKHQVVYKTDHHIPRKELIKESLTWLDRYFGPVN